MTMDEQEKQRGYRVQNAMKRIDLADIENLKRWAIVKLLKWQPQARRIRFEARCGVRRCRSTLSMTYQLEDHAKRERDKNGEVWEGCGYFCPSCGFSNAGSKPIFKRRNAMTVADGDAEVKAYLERVRWRIVNVLQFVDYHSDDKRK